MTCPLGSAEKQRGKRKVFQPEKTAAAGTSNAFASAAEAFTISSGFGIWEMTC
jgi:hypothetical protein